MSKRETIYAIRDARRKGDFALEARLSIMLAKFDSK